MQRICHYITKSHSFHGLLCAVTLIVFTASTAPAQQLSIPTDASSPQFAAGNMPYWPIAQNDEAPAASNAAAAAADDPKKAADVEKTTQDAAKTAEQSRRRQENLQQISVGQSAFQNRCVQCHDADKSLLKTKSLGAWRATVARMARQDGANIPDSEWEPISVYLASKNSSGDAASTGDVDPALAAAQTVADNSVSEVTVFGTVSPTFRTHGAEIQNPGFFGDVWAGVAWEPSAGPLSAKMVACISCHNEHDEGYLSRLEIVQASITLNLGQVLRGEADKSNAKGRSKGSGGACTGRGEASCLPPSQFGKGGSESNVEAFVEAGRLVVPFGAFSSQVNPGVYRTVTRPLMFNMGQRVLDENIGDPVLPMPYSDEGADLNISVPLFDNVSMSIDAYVVNGLQGSNSVSFDDSRDYVDNNRTPAIGGRWTVGSSSLKLGTSLISGQYNGNTGSGVDSRGLNFLIYGADVSWRFEDRLRVQAEFAQRNTHSYYDFAAPQYAVDKVSGYYVESELLLSRAAHMSALCRWDNQQQKYGAFDPGSSLPSAAFGVNRLTYGLNWTLPGGSLFMVNMERWYLPSGLGDMNVVGVRWAASF